MVAPGNEPMPAGEALGEPKLLEIWSAPRLSAAAMPVSRSVIAELLASTRMMWQLGHSAETASRSSDSSSSQSEPALAGIGEAPPLWLTLVKQPLATVHAGRPYVLRYVARSVAGLGSSPASTTAIVSEPPAVCDR